MKKNNIFDIVKPYNNDKVSFFDKEYLERFLNNLNNYYLELRDELNIPNNYTFGLEIEVENVNYSKKKRLQDISLFKDWKEKKDYSLRYGFEVVSPKLIDNNDTWIFLANLLNDLSNYSYIENNTAGQIHFGSQIIGINKQHYINLIKLWAAYENVIFRFGYGEFLTERKEIKYYSYSLIKKVYEYLYKNESLENFWLLRDNSLSYSNLDFDKIDDFDQCIEKQTIEVRSPNGSLNPIIWQNNVNFFAKLFMYAKSDRYDNCLILKRIKTLYNKLLGVKALMYYREVDLEAALELADLIFDNNVDKVYFLRQYIKNFDVGLYNLVEGKKFTKCKDY